jgi:hypothetical protein
MIGANMRVLAWTVFLILIASAADAQNTTEEPGWSVMVISVADACGADAAKVDLAAGYVAEWAKRNLKDPARLTKESVLANVKSNKDIRDILQTKNGNFIYPCSRWRYMLEAFNDSKGAVMGGVEADAAPVASDSSSGSGTEKQDVRWNNRNGKCSVFLDPPGSSIDRVIVSFDTDGDVNLQISLSLNSPGIAVLGPRRKDQCRFYADIKGSITVAGEQIVAEPAGSMACDRTGDKIGSQNQFFDMTIKGENRVSKAVSAIVSNDTLPFVLANGPKSGQSISIPIKGLKEAIRAIGICPASVLRAVAN